MFQGKFLRSLSTLSHVMFPQVWIHLKKLFVKVAASAEGSQLGQARGAQGLLCRTESSVGCEREPRATLVSELGRAEDGVSGGWGSGGRFLPIEFVSQLSDLGHVNEVPNVCALTNAAAQLAPEFRLGRVCSLCKYAQMASAGFSDFSLVVILVGFLIFK